MSFKNIPLLKFNSPKPAFFLIKNPKYVSQLINTSASSSCLAAVQARRIKTCKFIRNFIIFFPTDSNKKDLCKLLCKFHQKTISIFTANTQHYHEIIRSPQKYTLQMNDVSSWRVLFQKRSLCFLTVNMNPETIMLPEKRIRWVLYHLKHCKRIFGNTKGIEVAGNIVNKQTEKILEILVQTIQQQCSEVWLEIKVWDNEHDHLQWLNLPIMKKTADSVYFVNKYDHANTILKPIQNFPSFTTLHRLEFWIKLFPNSDFLGLEKLKECRTLQEMRLRFEFEVDIQLVSQKFLTHIKFPESLTYLTLYISGLRLFWINDQPQSKQIATDKYVAPFLEEFANLPNLKTFQFTLYEFRIEFSPIMPIILHHLKSLEELFLVMTMNDFDFKLAEKFPILDFGYLCKELNKVFSQLKLLSIEFPGVFLEGFDTSINSLQNLQTLSLGYRIASQSKELPRLNLVLEKLNPDKIIELNLTNCNTDQDEEFKRRFEAISRLKLLQNLTMGATIKSIRTQLFDHFCSCVNKLSNLAMLSCRFERATMEDKEWMTKFNRMLGGMRNISLALISTRKDKFQFER